MHRRGLALLACLLWGCTGNRPASELARELVYDGEKHFAAVRQLTREGENSAEAYFSPGGEKLILQSTRDGFACDQIFTMNIDGSDVRLVSTGKGRATCGYFLGNGESLIFSSTHLAADSCPPPPDYSRGYIWPVYPSYDIFVAPHDGSQLRALTTTPGYDAEATVSPDGQKIVFTSMRDGDLDIYTMDADGSNVRRLTSTLGYDGGPFYSPDGSKIVFRAHHPVSPEEVADYQRLLQDNLIRPSRLEIFVMNADGSKRQQITNNGAANFAPCFHPDGRRVIFSSNLHNPKSRGFDLYMIALDGSGLERITYFDAFDGFPMFSPDGTELVFCSNRNAAKPGQTNVFVADWIE